MASVGSQASAVFYGLGFGRGGLPQWRRPATQAGGLTVAGLAVRAGHTDAAIEALAQRSATLDPDQLAWVLDPLAPDSTGHVSIGGEVLRQADQRSCGAASVVLVDAAGDPAIALWLLTGEDPTGVVARRYPAASAGAPATPQARWLAAQRETLKAARRVGPAPTWPAAWGTPPWGAARRARWGRTTFQQRIVDDLVPESLQRAQEAVVKAAEADVPSLVWVGGDSRQGWKSAIPRHVVVVAPRARLFSGGSEGEALVRGLTGELAVVEPSTGRVFPIDAESLTGSSEPHEAFGGWSHITWVLVARPVAPWW